MKTIRPCMGLLCLPFLVSLASAQSSIDVHGGLGTVNVKSTGEVIDTFGDGFLYRTPKLNGVFMGFGGNLMLSNRFGVGAQVSFQPNRPDYAGLKSRTMFYDFNGIYQPISSSRAALQLQGGIGGVNMRFYFHQQGCNVFFGCVSSTDFVGSSNHFQVHGGAGVQVYLTEHFFVRPQLDIRYVPNFFQFGSNWVPGAMVWAGYTFGDRQ